MSTYQDEAIDTLHYELLKLERYVPSYTEYLQSFKSKNKFFQAFIIHKVNYISILCCELLIKPNGKCDWNTIEEISRRGFYVGPGEQDSFGWLTGLISTSKGSIVYG